MIIPAEAQVVSVRLEYNMANQKTDFLDALFNYGIDIRRRRVHLRDTIDEETIQDLVKGLLLLEDQNKQPIEIHLSSFGGECYEMFAAFDIIRGMESHVTIIASGKIMSAASLIICAADERKCYPNTMFMIHEMAWETEHEKLSHHDNEIKHGQILDKMWADAMAIRTNKTAKQWLALVKGKHDRYFDAEKALDWGIIDKVIEVD